MYTIAMYNIVWYACSIVATDQNTMVGPVSRPAHFDHPAMVLSPSLETRSRGQDYAGRRSRPGETIILLQQKTLCVACVYTVYDIKFY